MKKKRRYTFYVSRLRPVKDPKTGRNVRVRRPGILLLKLGYCYRCIFFMENILILEDGSGCADDVDEDAEDNEEVSYVLN